MASTTYVDAKELGRQWMANLSKYYDENPEAKASLERLKAAREQLGEERFAAIMKETFGHWLTNGNPYAKGAVFK